MKKIITYVLCGFILFSAKDVTVYGADTIHTYETNCEHNNKATIKADIIQYKYRANNGVLQYRRWNSTQNCWVDSDWIDV